MKKQLIALAVGGAFCGVAFADGGSVTVYGILDAGVMTASKACSNAACNAPTAPSASLGAIPLSGNVAAGSTTGSVTAFQDAQMLPSIYGLKGGEDLGGGLKAGFTLEGGFSTANGTHNSPGIYQTQIFGRVADLTLGGSWGTVGAGMQVDPAFIAAIATEARGMTDSLSSLEHWILATAGLQTSFALQGGIFDTNAITYTYEGNGLFIGLLYGFGGVAGSTSANSQTSIGASWTGSGVTVAAGWAKGNSPSTGAGGTYSGTGSEIYHVGAGYATGPFAVRLQYAVFKSDYNNAVGQVSPGSDVKDFNIGFDWKVGANTANIAYYNSKDDAGGPLTGGKTTEIALMDTYSLSKRTSVYAQLASVKVDAFTATTGPGLSGGLGGVYTPVGLTAVAGDTTTFFGLGIQHTF